MAENEKLKIDPASFLPHLLRAYWQWLSDHGDDPFIAVDATYPGVRVPQHAIKDGAIILNLSMTSTNKLNMGDNEITFGARFNQRHFEIVVPVEAVRAIFGRYSQQVTQFALPQKAQPLEEVASSQNPATSEPASQPETPKRVGHLSVVK